MPALSSSARAIRDDFLFRIWRDPSQAATLTGRDWGRVVFQARAAAVGAKLSARLRRHGVFDDAPEAAKKHFVSEERSARRTAELARSELNRIAGALAGVDATPVLLKGAAFLLDGLTAGEGRFFSDVDVMVSKAALAETEAALLADIWAPVQKDAYDEFYYRAYMHEIPPLSNIRTGWSLDLHHTILPPTNRVKIDGDVLIESAPLIGAGPWRRLSDADILLHAALHMFQDGPIKGHLRELFDIDDLVADFARDPAFWETFVARVRAFGAERPAWCALTYANRYLGTPAPADALNALGAAAPRFAMPRALMDACLDAVFRIPPPRPKAPGAEKAAEFLLYCRSHWLRMPPLTLARHLARKALRRGPLKRGA